MPRASAAAIWRASARAALTLNYSGAASGSFTFTPGAVFTLTTLGRHHLTWSPHGTVSGLFVGGGGGGGGSYDGIQGGVYRGGKGGAGGFYEASGIAGSGWYSAHVGGGEAS